MSLLDRQRAFRAEIAAADDAGPASSVGMQIYRDAYRGRLLSALEESFARTRGWVGEAAFTAAACHFVLTSPPRGWTLDAYGSEFPETLATVFADDPEVAELAWLEWHRQQAFADGDRTPLDPARLAAAGYTAADWDAMRFEFAPGFALRRLTTNCIALWQALEVGQGNGPFAVEQGVDHGIVVWRQACAPRHREMSLSEFAVVEALAGGATLGCIAALCTAQQLGAWLAQWLGEGLFSEVRTP